MAAIEHYFREFMFGQDLKVRKSLNSLISNFLIHPVCTHVRHMVKRVSSRIRELASHISHQTRFIRTPNVAARLPPFRSRVLSVLHITSARFFARVIHALRNAVPCRYMGDKLSATACATTTTPPDKKEFTHSRTICVYAIRRRTRTQLCAEHTLFVARARCIQEVSKHTT